MKPRCNKYTKQQIAFLKDNASNMSFKELTAAFNKRFNLSLSYNALHGYCLSHEICKRKRPLYHKYSIKEKQFIRTNIKNTSFKKLAEQFNAFFNANITAQQLELFCYRHGMKNGRPGGMPKGAKHKDAKPVGYESYDGKYIRVKCSDGKYKRKHVFLWESANGPVPKGHAIIFTDGNKLNFSLDNLLLVKRGELVTLNKCGLIFSDVESTKAGLQIARIKSAVRRRQKELK